MLTKIDVFLQAINQQPDSFSFWFLPFFPAEVFRDSLLRRLDCDPDSLPAHLFSLSSEVCWAPGSRSQTFSWHKAKRADKLNFSCWHAQELLPIYWSSSGSSHQGSAGTKQRDEINRSSCCFCVGITKQPLPTASAEYSRKAAFLVPYQAGVPLYRIWHLATGMHSFWGNAAVPLY